jgi:SAM-dependent methyltransferase
MDDVDMNSQGEANLLDRACPSCGSLLWSFDNAVASRPTAESLPPGDIQQRWFGFFGGAPLFFTYRRCAACHLLYCPKYLQTDDTSSLYSSMPDNTWGVPAHLLQRTQNGYFTWLTQFSPLKGDYLELGPDIGLFTSLAASHGHFDRLLLCEPNADVYPALRKVAGDHATMAAGLDDPMFLQSSDMVDVIVLVHVLDHLVHPLDVLVQLRAHCRPEAILLLVTHNEASPMAGLLGRRWPAYCLQHPQLFRPSTLDDMLRRADFEVLSTSGSINWFPLGYLVHHLLYALGCRRRFPLNGGLGVPLPLGNIITIARPCPAQS